MSTARATLTLGPADQGRAMTLEEFLGADRAGGWLYELSRGVVDVTEIPGLPHGMVVDRLAEMFIIYRRAHPGVIQYRAGGGECRIRVPGMASDRHPDQAVYLRPAPEGPHLWARWVPSIVVEVLSRGGEHRDMVLKREEYRRIGVEEYWIFDRFERTMRVDRRAAGGWEELTLDADQVHRTGLLPGLEVGVAAILGPEPEDGDEG